MVDKAHSVPQKGKAQLDQCGAGGSDSGRRDRPDWVAEEAERRGSTEEAVLELHQDAMDGIAHLMQNVNNRLTFKALNLAERYRQGRLKVCVDLSFDACGEKFSVILWARQKHRGRVLSKNGLFGSIWLSQIPFAGTSMWGWHHVPTPRRSQDEGKALGNDECLNAGSPEVEAQGDQSWVVLVPDVHIMEGLQKCSVTSGIGLGFAEEFYGTQGQLFFQIRKGCFKRLNVPPVWEPDVQACEFKTPDLLCTLRIDLGYDFVRARLEQLPNCGVQILDVGFGSFDLLESRDEPFRVHDIEALMDKRKTETDEANLAQIAKRLLTTPPKPREDNTQSKKRGSSKPKKKAGAREK